MKRTGKELLHAGKKRPETVYIDGFNTIITLEVALSGLIMECAGKYDVAVSVQVINDVDRVLEQLDGVISGDAIILNKCGSWLNIMPGIVEQIE